MCSPNICGQLPVRLGLRSCQFSGIAICDAMDVTLPLSQPFTPSMKILILYKLAVSLAAFQSLLWFAMWFVSAQRPIEEGEEDHRILGLLLLLGIIAETVGLPSLLLSTTRSPKSNLRRAGFHNIQTILLSILAASKTVIREGPPKRLHVSDFGVSHNDPYSAIECALSWYLSNYRLDPSPLLRGGGHHLSLRQDYDLSARSREAQLGPNISTPIWAYADVLDIGRPMAVSLRTNMRKRCLAGR
ncbi:hypothetical protein DFH06DRAFT_474421 [Mycena polygramma]|nr:hypothetical protein DFH06DRAFT_474421 [Mycena polygramma]